MTEFKDLHILIAEDDLDDSSIIDASFQKHPDFIKVDLVQNGVELLTFLKNADVKPDVILTDINMPLMNGIDAIKEMCEDSVLRNIPTFVYSTAINPIYEARCMELGTKGFLIKPFTLSKFDEIPYKVIQILKGDSKT